MRIIVLPLIITLIFYVGEIFLAPKHRTSLWFYIAIFVIYLVGELSNGGLKADEPTHPTQFSQEFSKNAERMSYYIYVQQMIFIEQQEVLANLIDSSGRRKDLTPSERVKYRKLYEQHLYKGHEWLEEGKNISILIPDWNLRTATLGAFASCCSQIVSGTPAAQAARILTVWVYAYLVHQYDTFHKIYHAACNATYNFEMADFYQDVLIEY